MMRSRVKLLLHKYKSKKRENKKETLNNSSRFIISSSFCCLFVCFKRVNWLATNLTLTALLSSYYKIVSTAAAAAAARFLGGRIRKSH